MKSRCLNSNDKRYERYGGRGIKICDDWKNDFEMFYRWAITNGYKENLTIDRIDTNGNYEPSNCRWITTYQQNRNYSKNHNITYNGITKCVSDWADYFNINRTTVLYRLKVGKPLDEVFRSVD